MGRVPAFAHIARQPPPPVFEVDHPKFIPIFTFSSIEIMCVATGNGPRLSPIQLEFQNSLRTLGTISPAGFGLYRMEITDYSL